MNFSSISTLNSYTKTMGMQWKLAQRKESNDFTSKGNTIVNNWLEEKIAKEKEQVAQMNEKEDNTLNTIRAKIFSGKKLTLDEKRYLQAKDPQTYEKMRANEMEQKSYEEALKRCETKEDVERLKMSQMAKSFSAVSTIMHDSAIPEGAKLGLVMQELQKLKLIEASTQEFVESGQYGKLPTEAELRKAEKDLEEAEKAEKEIPDSENVQDSENADNVEQEASPESVDKMENPDMATATSSQAAKEAKKETTGKGDVPDPVSLDNRNNREMTRVEAEQTPEAQKVRRAKAQKAYQHNSMLETADSAVMAATKQIEVNA